jgi:hypothetical protein
MTASLKDSMVLHYRMNDNAASTTVVDSSGNGYNGTAQQNTSVLHTTGKVGGALTFADNDYIDLNDTFASTFQSDFTVSCWIKPDDGMPAANEENIFLGCLDGSFNGVEIWHYTSGGKCAIAGWYYNGSAGKTLISNDNIMPDGAQGWHHLVVVFAESTACKICFDNIDVTRIGGAAISDMSPYAVELNPYIGVVNGQEDIYSKMAVDDFRIFNRAITQEEITFLYNGGYGTECSDYPHPVVSEIWGF